MEHDKVCEIVREWLESGYPSPKEVGEWPVATEGADVIVYTPKEREGKTVYCFHRQVECKGTKNPVHEAIGKCLKYYTEWDGLLTYLAVPEDYKELRKLEVILEFMNLPIGVYIVHDNRKVEVKKEAKGKDSVYLESKRF
jgi:hypothetical protein